MKKLILIILFLLAIPFSVKAIDFLDNQAACISLMKQLGGFNSDYDMLDTSLIKLWKMSMITVNQALSARQVIDSLFLKTDTSIYRLDSMMSTRNGKDTLIEVKSVILVTTTADTKSLKHIPSEFWDTLNYSGYSLSSKTTGNDRMPSAYDWKYNTLMLYPTPYMVDFSLIIAGTGAINDIDTVTAATYITQIPSYYRIAVLYYAMHLFFEYRKEDPNSSAKSDWWLQRYNLAMNVDLNTISRGINGGILMGGGK